MADSAREVAMEQRFVDRAYARLEVLKARTRQTNQAVSIIGSMGSTPQARLARDVFAHVTARRMADLEFGELPLIFGRIDDTENQRFHIGRVGILDEDFESLVVDWRAPAAERFYQATPVEPRGVVRRRHLQARGQRVIAVEDELLDAAGAKRHDLVLVGEAALLAAIEKPRTGHMGDIVSTIQAEQDRIIRAPLPGILVVHGGPGTGKTAVALHRAAYLLFTYRRQLQHTGALLIGPSPAFLRYVERVLPSLGEQSVRLRSLETLVPGYPVTGTDSAAAARIKGDVRFVGVLRRAVAQSGKPHAELTERAVLRWLYASPSALAQAAEGILGKAEQESLRRSSREGWTPADLPLLDELVRILGKRKRRRKLGRDTSVDDVVDGIAAALPTDQLLRDHMRSRLRSQEETAHGRDEREDLDEYGHVLVDEAQELSPMQWRALARRCPSGSMTIVGDLAQGTGVWAPSSWEEVRRRIPGRAQLTVEELTINYRTPRPIAALAATVLAEIRPEAVSPRAVRDSHEPPRFVEVSGGELAEAVTDACVQEQVAVAPGTVCVIVPDGLADSVRAALEPTRVTVLRPGQAHGLEFDAVVVVEPDQIVAQAQHGLRQLYVALTRATQRLTIVHTGAPVKRVWGGHDEGDSIKPARQVPRLGMGPPQGPRHEAR